MAQRGGMDHALADVMDHALAAIKLVMDHALAASCPLQKGAVQELSLILLGFPLQ